MDILIRGMEMPKPGQIVLVEIDENGNVFAAYDGGRTKLSQYQAISVADVAPVRHGRWLPVDELEDAFDCSECDAMVSKRLNYCPKCGADMRGES